MNLTKLQKKISLVFKSKNLLEEALTHRSYLNENPSWPVPHNERLEYLGDAVLELAVSEFLFHNYPDAPEGQLTSFRAALVNYQMLGQIAREIGLGDYLLLSRGEAKDTGKAREVILANALEALIGAVYLDRGYRLAKKFIAKCVLSHLQEILEFGLYQDAKSHLQEIIQEKFKITPSYRVLEEYGPDHQKKFLVGVFCDDELIAKGAGSSKQEAERKAAEAALEKLKE
jgi:ribonuclease-3